MRERTRKKESARQTNGQNDREEAIYIYIYIERERERERERWRERKGGGGGGSLRAFGAASSLAHG